ncbi:MAG: ATP-binding protein, partial [Candidatus Cloacimonetes bacterium]|nr:ATP-binding protein [Candidatus Cloacimonadota bacterium]
IDTIIAQKRALLGEEIKVDLLKFGFLFVFLIILFTFIAKHTSINIKNSINIFSIFFKKAEIEHIQIDINKLDISEFKTLAVNVNHMVEQRKKAEKEITKHRDQLDELVKERTIDLEDKNVKLERSQQALALLMADVNESRSELDVSNTKLETANKELEAFSYSVSHDLRAPLRHINGFTKLLKKNINDVIDEKSQKNFDKIIRSSQQMNQLINDLLIFSRTSRKDIHKIKVNMKTVVDEVLQTLAVDIKKNNISIIVDDLPDVKIDVSLIRQAWVNLISNAVKFTGKADKPNIHIGTETDAEDNVVFFIKDNGVGFNQKYVDKIFDVFQRLHSDNEFSGTGVGLANVKQIITKHGGNITAEGKINEGASFFFTLSKA